MRVAFAAGGSGGHVYPAVAVAEELTRRLGGAWAQEDALFFVTGGGIERRLLAPYTYPTRDIRAARLKRGKMLGSLWTLARGVGDAIEILKEFQPDVVLSAGGFVSAPAVVAAWWLGRPSVLLEQNTVPGRANKLLARLAHRVVTAYEEAGPYFSCPSRVLKLGNPLRFERGQLAQREPREKRVLFVQGGSQGARCINETVAAALPRLTGELNVQVVFVCGKRDEELIRERLGDVGPDVELVPYCDNVEERLRQADVVLSRAGATTIAELVEFAVPSILVPIKNHVGDHQRRNALVLATQGASTMVEEDDFGPDSLVRALSRLLERDASRAMRTALEEMRWPGAATRVAELLLEIGGGGAK